MNWEKTKKMGDFENGLGCLTDKKSTCTDKGFFHVKAMILTFFKGENGQLETMRVGESEEEEEEQ